jgi:hypothetical protein
MADNEMNGGNAPENAGAQPGGGKGIDPLDVIWQDIYQNQQAHQEAMNRLTAVLENQIEIGRRQDREGAGGPSTGRHLNVPTPNEYDGTVEKYDMFSDQLELCFLSMPHCFPTHQSKIWFALALMTKGGAADWRKTVQNEIRDLTFVPISWEVFKTRMNTWFSNPHRRNEAQGALEKI